MIEWYDGALAAWLALCWLASRDTRFPIPEPGTTGNWIELHHQGNGNG